MHYYVRTARGWQEVNKQYFREFIDYLRRAFAGAVNLDEIIALRTLKSECPLGLRHLVEVSTPCISD